MGLLLPSSTSERIGTMRVKYGAGVNSKAAVLKEWSVVPLGSVSQNLFFIILLRCSLPFYTVLTFALMMQKQWWVKLTVL